MAEGARLESVYTSQAYRGFESPLLLYKFTFLKIKKTLIFIINVFLFLSILEI